VTSFLGQVADFEAGAAIDGKGELFGFSAFPKATAIPFSAADDFIGLAFTLGDGIHFGYAEIDGTSLVDYAFESTPGAGILTAAVPEAGTMTLLAGGLFGLGFVRRRVRATD